MNRIVGKRWRDSASLIMLNKRTSDAFSRRKQAVVNYEVLLQTRTSRASFPNSVVFPGGVHEAADASADWLDLLRSFGYSNNDIDALHYAGDPVTPIFQPDPAKRHVALRITAIRETFEELGLLICSQQHKPVTSPWASVITDIDIKHWQPRVSKNPKELLTLCRELKCYPDIWSLHYWSNWLTPVFRPKRFNTAFFITAFEQTPPSLTSNEEVITVKWSSPFEILEKNEKKELELYPPQVYELNRITHLNSLGELIKFAQERSCRSNDLFFPIIIEARDGFLQVLPGDDLYISNVDYSNDISTEHKDKTILELRTKTKQVHRLEITDTKTELVLQNYTPKNHINMGDKIIQAQIPLPYHKK